MKLLFDLSNVRTEPQSPSSSKLMVGVSGLLTIS